MNCFFFIILSLSAIVIINTTTTVTAQIYGYHYCDYSSNFTSNSPFQENLKASLSSLSTANLNSGFYNSSSGQNPDRATSFFVCRGDLSPSECRACITATNELLPIICPNQKTAIIWFDKCLYRHSNESFLGRGDVIPQNVVCTTNNVTNNDQFKAVLADLMPKIIAQAVSSTRLYAINVYQGDVVSLYSQLQCTPDLSPAQCNRCLSGSAADVPGSCDGKQGSTVVKPSCILRYQSYPFFAEPVAPPPPSLLLPPPPSRNSNDATARTKVFVPVIASIVVGVLLLVSIYYCIRRKNSKRKEKKLQGRREMLHFDDTNTARDEESQNVDLTFYDLDTMIVATNNFSLANKLGQGGFGPVYKGELPNSLDIAVKRLSKKSGQGIVELKNEMLLIAKLQHRNLVRLLGCCVENGEKMLVYEYMPNKSLDYFIFDESRKLMLDWKKRFDIIRGIARGVLYLHRDSRLTIIHRDLKSSNILLDFKMNPKISDFGLARIFGREDKEVNISRVVGTYGYMAPEYALGGLVSLKSDVYSFGVLLLEIISGKKNGDLLPDEQSSNLISYAWELWRDDKALQIVDSSIMESCSISEVLRCIQIGLLCVQDSAAVRPTMSDVLYMLNNEGTLRNPKQPTFAMRKAHNNNNNNNHGSSSTQGTMSQNEVTMTTIEAR